MKKKIYIFLYLLLLSYLGFTQNLEVNNLQWDKKYELHLKLSNDSSYVLDVKALPHSSLNDFDSTGKQLNYYPVTLNNSFVEYLKSKKLDAISVDSARQPNQPATLWNAINQSLGGGWVHFVNCLLYALETNQLNLTAPLMQRPSSNWKPNPVTETYNRTKKWKYYTPVNQKEALKEYNIKKVKGELQYLNGLPKVFIDLFLETSDREYRKFKKYNLQKQMAKVDLVRLLLGSNYLGNAQIDYIKSMVLKASQQYMVKLPSIIILDDMNAAVAMSLDENGYKVDKVVFGNQKDLSADEVQIMKDKIDGLISRINLANKKLMQDKLRNRYK